MIRTARSSQLVTFLAVVAASTAGCDDGPTLPPEIITTAPAPEPPLDPSATTSAAPTADPADAGSDAAASAAALEALAGKWEGAYDAKKGRVAMPSGIKDEARTAEDGKLSSGPGLVQLEIQPNGDVTGKSQGSLGAASVRGKLDGKTLRASFVPDDPLSPRAMTGVLIGIVKGEVIEVELRVAGPDALIVRQANFDLKKKPQ